MNRLRHLFRGKGRRRHHEPARRSAPAERLQFSLADFHSADVFCAAPPVQISMPTEKPLDPPVPFRRERSKSYPNLDIFKEARQIGGEDDNEHESIPVEIVARGPKALEAYHRAIEEGKASVKRVPIMFIGQGQSGKTSLKRSLKGEEFNPEESSTIGIETDPSYCKVSTEVWKMGEATHERDSSMEPISFEKHTAQYIVNSLEKNERRKELKPSPSRYDNVPEKKGGPSSLNNNCVSSGAPKVKAVPEEIASLVTMLLQVVRVDEDKDEIFSTLWDFGGQSVYFSTHPPFLTRGAIYLLVYNLNRDPEEKSISRVKRGLFK